MARFSLPPSLPPQTCWQCIAAPRCMHAAPFSLVRVDLFLVLGVLHVPGHLCTSVNDLLLPGAIAAAGKELLLDAKLLILVGVLFWVAPDSLGCLTCCAVSALVPAKQRLHWSHVPAGCLVHGLLGGKGPHLDRVCWVCCCVRKPCTCRLWIACMVQNMYHCAMGQWRE